MSRGVAGLIEELAARARAAAPGWRWTLTMPPAVLTAVGVEADQWQIQEPVAVIAGLPVYVMPLIETEMVAATPVPGSGPAPEPAALYLSMASGQIDAEPPTI